VQFINLAACLKKQNPAAARSAESLRFYPQAGKAAPSGEFQPGQKEKRLVLAAGPERKAGGMFQFLFLAAPAVLIGSSEEDLSGSLPEV
jgi:hypothetical protein